MGRIFFCLSSWCPPAAPLDLQLVSMSRWLHLLVTDHDWTGLGGPDGDVNTVVIQRWLIRQADCLMVPCPTCKFWVLGWRVTCLCEISVKPPGLVEGWWSVVSWRNPRKDLGILSVCFWCKIHTVHVLFYAEMWAFESLKGPQYLHSFFSI